MTALTDLFALLDREFAGWQSGIKSAAILRAAREICRATSLWRAALTAIDVVQGQAEYTLTPPADGHIVRIPALLYNNVLLRGMTEDRLSRFSDNWRNASGTPSAFVALTRETVRLYPTPDTSLVAALEPDVVIQPSLTATTVPDWLADQYEEILVDGALSWLFAMPLRDWYRPQAATYHRARFEQAINALRAERQVTRANVSPQIAIPPFGGSRNGRGYL